MNHLGITLGWLAIQVGLILLPALVLNTLARRRSPDSAAWVASLSLGLAVVLVPVAFLPESRPTDPSPVPVVSSVPLGRGPVSIDHSLPEEIDPALGHGSEAVANQPGFRFRWAWDQIGRQAAAPVARVRSWGSWLAIGVMMGTGIGLVRLALGLWAIGLCRSRGRLVDDRSMLALLEDLRGRMGCRRRVELRELLDLATPATAGWRRPMILLPDDWQAWDEDERRAVLAHELAHVVRGDYRTGLLARFAVILYAYHPMVRWMAGRLHFQQELAADLIGAHYSGGRSRYLVALSRLALKQDRSSPRWPARAFLPTRGTLIRRITMLRNVNEFPPTPRSTLSTRRGVTAIGLLALTVAVATLKGPARAEDKPLRVYSDIVANVDETPTRELPFEGGSKDVTPTAIHPPFEVRYLPENTTGVIAVRPAAIARRWGTGGLTTLLRELLRDDFTTISKVLKADPARVGSVKLEAEDIDSIVCGVSFGQTSGPGKDPKSSKLHTIQFSGLTLRTVGPFDWLAFFRLWNLNLEEVKESGGVYYRTRIADFPENAAIYFPDDRTLVLDNEAWITKRINRPTQVRPAYLRGADWDQVSRGLLAFAIDNHDDVFAKDYDLSRPDDAVALSIFQAVDRWVLGISDSEWPALQALATCRSAEAPEGISRALQPIVMLGRDEVSSLATPAMITEVPGLAQRLEVGKRFFNKLQVQPTDRSVRVSSEGFVRFDEVISIVETATKDMKREARAESRNINR